MTVLMTVKLYILLHFYVVDLFMKCVQTHNVYNIQ